MTALLTAVFIASLLGSLHCAGMCGPFVAFATLHAKRVPPAPAGSLALQAAYHGGRLFAYVTLGAIAGVLGATLNLGGSLLGIGRLAGVFAGALLVGVGVTRVLGLAGVRVPNLQAASFIQRLVNAGHGAAARMLPLKRAWLVGLLTTLLPCGWLYAFVAVAAGTGQGWFGALVLFVFWAGTVPVLAGIGAGLGQLALRAGRPLQFAIAIIVVGLGLQSIAGRFSLPLARVATPAPSLATAIERVSLMLGKGTPRCH